jgi:hypothetical protein
VAGPRRVGGEVEPDLAGGAHLAGHMLVVRAGVLTFGTAGLGVQMGAVGPVRLEALDHQGRERPAGGGLGGEVGLGADGHQLAVVGDGVGTAGGELTAPLQHDAVLGRRMRELRRSAGAARREQDEQKCGQAHVNPSGARARTNTDSRGTHSIE